VSAGRETSPRTARPLADDLAFVVLLGALTTLPLALVTQMHLASGPYAVAFAINACALLAGSFTTGRLARRVVAERLFASGVALLVAASALACALDVFYPTPAGFVATFALFAFAFGIANPNAYAAALHDAGSDAGTLAGILGAAQMLGGALVSAVAAALPLPPSAGIGAVCFALRSPRPPRMRARGAGVRSFLRRVDVRAQSLGSQAQK